MAWPSTALASGVSWGAVISGAFVTAAIGLLLMTLGAGMGLSSMSMWPSLEASSRRAAAGAIVWIVLVQLFSCALGGYVAGRLRTKWVAVHTHEVYFRDTAHGLLVWAVSVVLSGALLGSIATSVARDLAARPRDGASDPADYYADALFRSAHPAAVSLTPEQRAEARAILARNLAVESPLPEDRRYLAALVSARTGLAQAEAERRVQDTIASERAALDESRRAIAHSLYWLVVALLVGAFAACFAAIYGGRRRDFVWS